MGLTIVAAGNKMPEWVQTPCQDYTRRLTQAYCLNWRELTLISRGKNTSTAQIKTSETKGLIELIPKKNFVIALDERGKQMSSIQFASALARWIENYHDVSFVIGGPDGLDLSLPGSRGASAAWADVSMAISTHTLPHTLVRVILAEQIYRAWSLNHGHPYHRN